MKFKNLKLRTKTIGAVAVLVLLLVAGASNIPANTVVITDETISDDSGVLMNFTNDWMNFINATFSGNVTAGNITLSGNITASYYMGDGSLLTGISASGGGDYDLTKIWNSNGNNWTATGAHIQDAINDLDNNSGMVWLPGNTTITTSSTIEIFENVRVDMCGCTIKPDADFDVVSMHKNAHLVNGKIDADDIASFTSAAILFDGVNDIGDGWYAGYGNFGHTYVGHMILQGNEVIGQHPNLMNGTGIKMLCVSHTNDADIVIGCYIENIDIHSFKYGIHLHVPGGNTSEGSIINSNFFTNINMMQCRYGITTDRNTSYGAIYSSIYGNKFENIVHEVNKCTDYALHTEGDYNEFDLLIWDWGLANNTAAAVTLDIYSNASILKNIGASDYIFDNGSKNYVWNRGYWEYGSGGAPGEISSPTTYNHTGRVSTKDAGLWVEHINHNSAASGTWSPTSVSFFFLSTTEPSMLVYGGVGDGTDYISLKAKATYAEIVSGDHLVLNPSFNNFVGVNITVPTSELHVLGTTTIDDILLLDGRTTDPPSLSDGMIWHNTTTDLLYCRLNGATYTFNLTAV